MSDCRSTQSNRKRENMTQTDKRIIFRRSTFFMGNIKITTTKMIVYSFHCENLVLSQNIMI